MLKSSKKGGSFMQYKFRPEGVCSQEMMVDIENGIIKNARIIGGCAGNTVGLTNLLIGMTVEEAIKRLKGIPCGYRTTSCPDQMAKGLEEILKKIG